MIPHVAKKVLPLILVLFFSFSYTYAQNNAPILQIETQISRIQNDSILPKSTFQQLEDLNEWLKAHPNIPAEYLSRLNQYLTYLSPKTYKSYTASIHEDIISQALPILQAVNDPGMDMESWTYSLLPEYYAAVKTLIPSPISKSATLDMANERPAELVGQFSRLFYTDDAEDLQKAILLSPHLVTKFMHYNNLVKTELSKSNNPNIQLLFEIYKQYRYSQNPYFLFPYLVRRQMSIQEAEAYSKEEPLLIQYLLPTLLDTNSIAKVSIKQKWDEIASKYVKTIQKSHFTPFNSWNLGALNQETMKTLTQSLFAIQNMLDPEELEDFMKWVYYKNGGKKIDTSFLENISTGNLLGMENRISQDKLTDTWHLLWGDNGLIDYIAAHRNQKEILSFSNSTELTENLDHTKIDDLKSKPIVPKYIIKKYHFNLSQDQKELIKLKNDPLEALKNVDQWLNKPYSKELLFFISEKYPLELVKNLQKIYLTKQGIEALINVGKVAPLSAKNFIIQPQHPWNYLLKNSKDSVIHTLYEINRVAGINTRAYLLLDDIFHHKVSITNADTLCRNSKLLTLKLIQLLSNPNVLGRYSIEEEISVRSLKFIRNFNISENTDQYFANALNTLSPEEIYTFMTYGEDEIIQRSFIKMLKTLLEKSPQGNVYPLIEKLGFNNFQKFIKECSYYGQNMLVFGQFTDKQKEDIVQRLLNHLEDNDINNAMQIAEIIISQNDDDMTNLLQSQLHKEYERVESEKSDKGVAIYGILSSLLAPKVQDKWVNYVAKDFKLPESNRLPNYELFNNRMENIQQYYFYNDDDGVSSFNNFIRSYERSPLEWEIKDLGTFIDISSLTGRDVKIFANKAKAGETGVQDMLAYMQAHALEPQVVVHRGLSTHTLQTFSRIPSSAKLILDGSCGGYHVQQVAIERAPDAQILCNRNIGTMYINDPMFKQISDDIRSGQDISWPDFWKKMDKRVGSNPYFKDYIPPHKNAATILIKALYHVWDIN